MRLAVLLLLMTTPLLAQNNGEIWSGVYTAAQAARGRTAFVKSCSNCHNSTLDGTVRAPALHGDKFMADWVDTNLYTLFTKLRDTMPATYPDSVADDVKLDILAYLLQANSFPAGQSELKLNEKALGNVQIVKRGEHDIPNFALVELTGCLEPGPGNHWMLTNAGDPVATKDETEAEPKGGPLGTQAFLLVSVTAFHPDAHRGHKMEARGLIYREPDGNRLNLTSLRMLSPDCR